jgi:hypothetical protein
MYGRAKSSTGMDLRSAVVVLRSDGEATRCRRGALRVSSTRSLSLPGRRTARRRSRIVGRAAETSGRSSRRKRARSFVAGLDSATRHVEVGQRGAQVHEGRVAAAQRVGQALQHARERLVLGDDALRRLVGIPDQVGERLALLGESGHRLGPVDDEALEGARVAVDLVDEATRARQRRVEVPGGLVGLLALALELRRRPVDDALQRARASGRAC